MAERFSPLASRTSRRAFVAGAAAFASVPAWGASARPAIPILTYHRFHPLVPSSATVSVRTFEEQLALLPQWGRRVVPLREALKILDAGDRLANPVVVMTVDDGHRSVYSTLFPLILRHRLPVTLFIYPSAISNADYALTWAQLGEMQATGFVDVQSHTYWHPNFAIEKRRLSATAYASFMDDQLQRSKRVLEQRLGSSVNLLAWPYGITSQPLENAARRAGYSAAFAYAGGLARPEDDRFALSRIPVSEADRGDRFAALIGARAVR